MLKSVRFCYEIKQYSHECKTMWLVFMLDNKLDTSFVITYCYNENNKK